MEKMTSKADQIIDELSKRLLIIEGKITDLLTRETLENTNENSQSATHAIAIGSAVLGQIGTAATTGFAASDEGIDVTVFAVEVTDNNNVKHYFKGCFPEVIFKIEDQVKIIAQPFEKNYALAKAVIDIKNNYMWTSQEIAKGRMKYRLWMVKIMLVCLIVTFVFFLILDFFLSGSDPILFSMVAIQITSLFLIFLFLFMGWRIGASFDEQSIELEAILLKLDFNNPTMISLYDYSVFNIMKKNNEKIEGYSTRWADYTYRIDLAKKFDAEKYGQ